jgi:hypothetical protein
MRIEWKIGELLNIRLILGDDFRSRAHSAFDPIWQNGEMSRNAAYRWLANELGLTRSECHMSLFDKAMCERVIDVCTNR